MRRRRVIITIGIFLFMVAGVGLTVAALTRRDLTPAQNPLLGKTLYVDSNRVANKTAQQYRADNDITNAMYMERISDRPGTTWLIGPSASDPKADHDIAMVARTSAEAYNQGAVPVYEMYAIPGRDACAGYSKSGFQTSDDYLAWVDRILAATKQPAVFSVEADAIAQTIHDSCLTQKQIADRYQLLEATMKKLSMSPMVLAAYLDAGHSEWFPDPTALVGPLERSGVSYGRGIAVNVSFFVPTSDAVLWSQKLLNMIGGNKAAIIDTSRNGKGAPDPSIKGDERWCNPEGRGLGDVPTTDTKANNIDAFVWIKNVGESDGSCNGYPTAGTFVPELAIDLARNAKE
ncbi:MAG: Secreted endoglucanase [Candidatus Saccharibacteria bacterium]|nr:Secreted endoglucanase [Candidatus Saccharibacteria bacterium]